MKITRNDVQERFTICVPYAWLDNHVITPNVIRLGANIGAYGVNYGLYLFHYGNTNYHIVTGYRPNVYDIKYYDNDLRVYAAVLDNIRADFSQHKISYDEATKKQDKCIYNLFTASVKAVLE